MEPVRSLEDIVPPMNRTLGWHVLEWTGDNLLQPDGINAGQPWEYTREQVRIVLRWYAINDQGKFVYRRGVIRRMKGHGKDPFVASLEACELCGPCRFGGWDEDGFPVAIPHPAPWIQNTAVNLSQTKNTMALFPGMFSPDCIDRYRIDIGKEIVYANNGSGRIEAVTSSARALEGSRPTFVVLNESHHWLATNDGLAMAETIRRNLGKSNDGSARSLEITNAHQPGEGSAAEVTYEAWRQSKAKDVYYDSLEAPQGVNIDDESEVKEALVAARGDSTWLDVDRLTAEIMDKGVTTEAMARRFYFNQIFETQVGSFISLDIWDSLADPTRTIDSDQAVVFAFDGSFNGDSTAMAVVTCEEDPFIDVVFCYEKPVDAGEDWEVPIEDVEEDIRKAWKAHNCKEVDADPYRWARSIQVLKRDRIKMVEFPQTPQRMTPATSMFREAAMNGKLRHSGHPILRRHIANAVFREDSRGQRITKVVKGSPLKIDLAVCSIMGFSRARGRKTTQRVYDMSALLAEE